MRIRFEFTDVSTSWFAHGLALRSGDTVTAARDGSRAELRLPGEGGSLVFWGSDLVVDDLGRIAGRVDRIEGVTTGPNAGFGYTVAGLDGADARAIYDAIVFLQAGDQRAPVEAILGDREVWFLGASVPGVEGRDTLLGGSGPDVLNGRRGDDFVVASTGGDRLIGGPGSDLLFLDDFGATLGSGVGLDIDTQRVTVLSTPGSADEPEVRGFERFRLTDFDDRVVALDAVLPHLEALAGDDRLRLGTLTERLTLGEGDDIAWLSQSEGARVDAGEGDDKVLLAEGEARGDGGDHLLLGSDADEILFGGTGDDLLQGRGGDDLLDGGTGADRVQGGTGEDILRGGLTVTDGPLPPGAAPPINVLMGGPGVDAFQVGTVPVQGGPGSGISGTRLLRENTVIADYAPGERIVAIGVAQDDIEIVQQGANLRIAFTAKSPGADWTYSTEVLVRDTDLVDVTIVASEDGW